MNRFFIFLIGLVFVLGIVIFVAGNTLSPFNEQLINDLIAEEEIASLAGLVDALEFRLAEGTLTEYLQLENVVILTSLVVTEIAAIAAAIQFGTWLATRKSVVAKPPVVKIVRRTLFITLVLFVWAAFRLFAVDLYLYALVALLVVLVELLIGTFNKPRASVDEARDE